MSRYKIKIKEQNQTLLWLKARCTKRTSTSCCDGQCTLLSSIGQGLKPPLPAYPGHSVKVKKILSPLHVTISQYYNNATEDK